jgi:hypothetical protein
MGAGHHRKLGSAQHSLSPGCQMGVPAGWRPFQRLRREPGRTGISRPTITPQQWPKPAGSPRGVRGVLLGGSRMGAAAYDEHRTPMDALSQPMAVQLWRVKQHRSPYRAPNLTPSAPSDVPRPPPSQLRARVFGVPAAPRQMSVGLAGSDVHRWVHPRVSRQYQRTSAQALPPSATMCSAGKRIPHIQQDLTTAGPFGA